MVSGNLEVTCHDVTRLMIGMICGAGRFCWLSWYLMAVEEFMGHSERFLA